MQDDLVRFARARYKAPEEIVFLDEMRSTPPARSTASP
jgi:hypothetical protein